MRPKNGRAKRNVYIYISLYKFLCCLIIYTKNYLFKLLGVCIIADRIETSSSRVQSDESKFKDKAVLFLFGGVDFVAGRSRLSQFQYDIALLH